MEISFSFIVAWVVVVAFLCDVRLGGAVTVASDVEVLKEIKDSIDPGSIPGGSCLSSWDFTVDPCDSAFGERFTCGLRCDQQRVTEITLDGAGYNGTLPDSLGKLSALQILDLSGNAFRGPLPASIGNLSSLQLLMLTRNYFSGEIPKSMGSLKNLEKLSLDSNLLEGSIAGGLGENQNLVTVELQGNKLGGGFPDLSGMRALSLFDASGNRLSGPIPAAALPPNLVELAVRNNALSGALALNLAATAALQVLDLSHNQLSGSLPAELFNHPSLEQVTLSNNRFTAIQVPGDYGKSSGLIALDLSYNQIQGPLPTFMATMPRLSSLSLQYNYFTGIIPFQYALKATSSLPGKEPLMRLLLAGNYLFGQIPAPFKSLSPGNVNMSFVDNCLLDCPVTMFFCQGGNQKTESACRSFTPLVP